MTSTVPRFEYDPREKLTVQDNDVFLTGTQALIRVVFDQMRRDRVAGLRTAAFVSGYPGSPLGTLDLELAKQHRLAAELGVTHLPGHNEELAATSVYGSQMAQTFSEARYDGVLGVWYGKGPGLDRAADAIRHAQYVGTARQGGVLAFVGDDPACKSSSIPNTTEHTLQDLGLPILTPSSVQEVLELGPHGVALSRLSGLWTSLRVVTDIADGTSTVAGSLVDPLIVSPKVMWGGQAFVPTLRGIPGPPWSLDMEAELRGPRIAMAREYGYLNGLNRVVVDPANARVAIVVVGHLYPEVRTSLETIGLDEAALFHQGVRLCQVRMQHPIDARTLREFADGVDRVIVVEEKRPVVERLMREALYRAANQPVVVGKENESGRPLIPMHGAIHADELHLPLYTELSAYIDVSMLKKPERRRVSLPMVSESRAPYFCSGCPHNSSTRVPDGAVVGGGIGCHGMTQLMDPEIVGNVASTTQMGSEGAQWLGMSPYVDIDHIFQNIGDGTFFHSGQLAVQAAVAAKAHITYKLLYNDAIAMTGGQSPSESNALAVPDVVEILLRQGVQRILITTEDTRRYRRVKLPSAVQVWDRSRIIEAQEVLRAEAGVTVLIHDQRCAAENRRDRKRNKIAPPEQKVVINQRICEGCGDCGAKSNCLSVEPVDTELGRKTQINQTTCNADFSCLDGDCPSFVTIRPPRRQRVGRSAEEPAPTAGGVRNWLRTVPSQPVYRFASDSLVVRMPGIGGTGVVTAAQVLGTAAMLDGYTVHGMDQTGLSQKAGPVISDLKISRTDSSPAPKASLESVDLLLGFDLIGSAAAGTQQSLRDGHTLAIISTTPTPSGAMVSNVAINYPETGQFKHDLARRLGAANVHWVDAAALTESLFGQSAGANIFMIGMAFQSGAFPMSADALERAIKMNGVAVDDNIAAFRAGRWYIADPAHVNSHVPGRPKTSPPSSVEWFSDEALPPESRRLANHRASDLVSYQDRRYAQRYVDMVRCASEAERRILGDHGGFTAAVAANLYKLMAYKDEYEVARLAFDPIEIARIDSVYGAGARKYWNLRPPVLSQVTRGKLRLGSWFTPVFISLRPMRKLRGTPLDPFGRTEVRRLERQLVEEYTQTLRQVIKVLDAPRLSAAVELAALPDMVRGYEQLKLDSGRRFLVVLSERRGELMGDSGTS